MSESPSHPAAERASDSDRPTPWRRALGGLWRLTWKSQLTLRPLARTAAFLLVVPILAHLTFRADQLEPYYRWTTDFYLLLLVPLFCLYGCGGLVRDDLQGHTLPFLLTRPVGRARFYLAKLACQLAWIQMLLGIEWLFLLTVGLWHRAPDAAAMSILLLGVQVLAVLAYGTLSALFGLLHSRYLVLGLLYGFIVEVGVARIPTNINSFSLSHHLQTLLARHPPLAELHDWTTEDTWLAVLVLTLAPVFLAGLGALIFTVKEYLPSEEMQR
ncbi:MAG TPA: ABC transporter permease [Candidatus Paceibacterota bacterium]|nr:ABC transporter permease [Verrucomicrobiota bacterium]HOX03386.1 ABC transporter permease [Verrucomicrobiota bacterium]HRZ46813.1 ABC transporter permease [Candidatus Paceibacterota bacterium]HRZ91800.1 ABC transporter permease [Candidatus Paceibacterota bacterium]